MTAPRCVLEDITVSREQPNGEVVVVLDRLSVCVRQGELVAVRGRSGSGKTTLLNVIAGLLRPDAGEVRIDDAHVWALDDAARADLRRGPVALVPQDGGLIDCLTGVENVLLARRSRPRRDAAVEALARVGVAHCADKLPGQMSMGERYRAGLARCLLRAPRVLLLDEPTAALDERNAEVVVTLLETLAHDDGVATLVASHDPRVLSNADRVVGLDG